VDAAVPEKRVERRVAWERGYSSRKYLPFHWMKALFASGDKNLIYTLRSSSQWIQYFSDLVEDNKLGNPFQEFSKVDKIVAEYHVEGDGTLELLAIESFALNPDYKEATKQDKSSIIGSVFHGTLISVPLILLASFSIFLVAAVLLSGLVLALDTFKRSRLGDVLTLINPENKYVLIHEIKDSEDVASIDSKSATPKLPNSNQIVVETTHQVASTMSNFSNSPVTLGATSKLSAKLGDSQDRAHARPVRLSG